MSEITLYYTNGACSMSPHALLRHLGIPFKGIQMTGNPKAGGLEAADGSLPNAEYRKINPGGFVPTLVVDGEVITEQFAVVTMIALLSPNKEAGAELLGRDRLERVRVAQWMAWLSGSLHSVGYGAFLRPDRLIEGREDIEPAIKAKGLKTIESIYALIDEKLDGKTYAVGEHLTVVDFFLYVVWGWGIRFAGIDMRGKYTRYRKVLQRVGALDSVRKTVEKEGVKLYYE
ncbi:hypothetical protein NUW58_g8214 [Xylaria curta]|uniref:Uncharacterized protein n=1 Tax=Xylaria curta TaxID=42375 RepID=A0ACC1NAZ0_9PEZI|nr:hypothetical protein NUW58_g8214 [Xylaria curta]